MKKKKSKIYVIKKYLKCSLKGPYEEASFILNKQRTNTYRCIVLGQN